MKTKKQNAQIRNFSIFRIKGAIETVKSVRDIYCDPVISQRVIRATDALKELLKSMKDYKHEG